MSQFSNANPGSLFPDEPDDDPRRQFEEQALAAFYASGTDLASVSYSMYDLAVVLLRVFEKPAPVDQQPPENDPFA